VTETTSTGSPASGPAAPHWEATQRAAFDDSRIGVVCTDRAGRIVEANGQFLKMLGHQWHDLQGRDFDEFVHPDDRWQSLEHMSEGGRGQTARTSYELRLQTATRRSLDTAVRAARIGVGSDSAGFVVMLADLSAERDVKVALDENRALLEQIIVSAPMVLFTFDRTGLITFCEARSTHQMLAVTELLDHNVWEVVRDQPEVAGALARGMAGETGAVELQLQEVHFNCQYRPIWGPTGQIVGVSGVAVDVSDLLSAVDDRHQLSEFLAMVSHELRTPLNVVLGFAELLASEVGGALSDRQKRYVGNIDSGGKQLLSLVSDILDLAKAKSGQMVMAKERLDIQTVLHLAAAQVAVLAAAKGVEIIERPVPVIRFTADGQRVHQILLNLLSKAIKVSPLGGSIELDGRQEPGEVQLTVTDGGIGIDPAERGVIFDEYRQAGDKRATGDGTGLGLPISRRLAGLMGGALTATSVVGEGSRFVLALPWSSNAEPPPA